ncbi:MAG: acyl-CoA synthetase [Gammaproteobacteria bacterium]
MAALGGRPLPAWLAQRERGQRWGMQLMAWVARRLGPSAGYAMIYPVCGYFLACAGSARRSSRQFLSRALGRTARCTEVYRHFLVFAHTLLDRAVLLSGRLDRFRLDVHGMQAVEAALQERRGLLLLGAHLGSFEVLRCSGIVARNLPLRIVMYEANAENIGAVLAAINPAIAASVIAGGRADTALRVREALDRGEPVGILADRALSGEAQEDYPFLGAPAAFPRGPFLLAAVLRVPVVLCYGLFIEAGRYAIHLERIESPAGPGREAAARALAARYVQRLEHYARLAPYNWFNFYDFWRRE